VNAAHPVTPRLLTEEAAADYLSLPRAAMKRVVAGRTMISGRIRWDRRALDAWLDERAGIAAKSPPVGQNDDDPEAAFDRFDQDFQNAPRRR
jgi:hypothetical protein